MDSKLASLEVVDLIPKVLMKDLIRRDGYKILCARRVDTRFKRPTILLEIEYEGGETRVTFLPVRFSVALDDTEIQEISDSQTYRVRCTGLTDNSPNVQLWNSNQSSSSSVGSSQASKRPRIGGSGKRK